MATLKQNDWRSRLLPAYFRSGSSAGMVGGGRGRSSSGMGAMFHVESGSVESGRRVVTHEFPKRDDPYSEDMGRRAREFTVRGYFIAYPKVGGALGDANRPDLYRENYMLARDTLVAELEKEGAGTLQLPAFDPVTVVCTRYRITEEERLGGYCTVDMSFVERGKTPFQEVTDSAQQLREASNDLKKQIASQLAKPSVNRNSQRITHQAMRERARKEYERQRKREALIANPPLPPSRPAGV